MSIRQQSASEHLEKLVNELRPFMGSVEITMAGADFDQLVERLATIRKSALIVEREAGSLRLAEAARDGRAIVEQLAGEAMGNMMFDTAEKVVRPDFRGKRS